MRYTSPALVHWEYQQPLCVGDSSMGDMWECPNFFELGDRHVHLVSALPLECFVHGYAALTKRVYPQSQQATRLTIKFAGFADGVNVAVRLWDMLNATFAEDPTSHA